MAPFVLAQQARKAVALAAFVTTLGPEGAVGLLMCPTGRRSRKSLAAFLAGEGLLSYVEVFAAGPRSVAISSSSLHGSLGRQVVQSPS